MRVAAFRDIETKLGCLATATMCCNLPDLAFLVEIAPLGGRERLVPHRVESVIVY